MQIDIFSDVICPWCLIGKRRLERALAARPDVKVEIRWRAFQLNPDMPAGGMDRTDYLDTKFGGPERAKQVYDNIRNMGRGEKIDFQFEKITRTPNTVKAHRVINRASNEGRDSDALVESLFSAYFFEGVDLSDDRQLAEVATVAGWTVEDTLAYLESDAGIQDVAAETRFAYENGISGVPCFIVDRRYAVAGAQEPEAFFPLFDLGKEELEKLAATGA